MPDLVVNQDLTDSQANLTTIDDEFRNASDNVKHESGIWGQGDLSDAMGAFVNDWWIHREKIEKSLSGLKDNVDKAVEGWAQTEQQLTQDITIQHDGASA